MEKQVLDEYEIQLILDAITELKRIGTINIPEETSIHDIVEALVRNQIQSQVKRISELEEQLRNERIKTNSLVQQKERLEKDLLFEKQGSNTCPF